mgnify:CR=1 FL=1
MVESPVCSATRRTGVPRCKSSAAAKRRAISESSDWVQTSRKNAAISASSRSCRKARISREKHKAAKRRLSQIRKEISALEKQIKELDTETYVKSRVLSNAFGKDPSLLKEYGQRLKEIPKQQRRLAEHIRRLKDEKEDIER